MKDWFVLLGYVGIVTGAAWHYAPLAPIVGGGILMIVGIIMHFRDLKGAK